MNMRVVIGQGIIPIIPVPTQREFGNFLRGYIDYTKNQEATERIHMWTGISIIAAALGRKVWMRRAHHTIFPNLYTLIVADPGLFHKSTSTAIGVDLLRDIPTMKIMADRITDASLIEALERAGDKFTYPISGGKELKEVRQSALFCYASEFSVMMKDAYGIVPELLTTFYDGGPQDSSKPWVKETRSAGQVKIYGPLTNLIGCTTPSSLKECIPVTQMEAGLASRIIFVIENELPENFVAIPKYDPSLAPVREKLLNDLHMIHHISGDMTMTTAAEEFYTEWYVAHMHFLHKRQGDRRFAGYFGRKATHIEKVAMILSIAESDSKIVELQHVEMAVELLSGLEKNMLNVIEHGGGNEDAPTMIKVDRYIRSYPNISELDLRRKFMYDVGQVTFGQVIDQLRQIGQIQQNVIGGRIYYSVVPGSKELGGWNEDETNP